MPAQQGDVTLEQLRTLWLLSQGLGGELAVGVADTDSRDAFSRVRVSNPDTLMEAKFHYNKNPMEWDELVANSGTAVLNQDESAILMTVTATDESRVVRQHHGYHPYEPGKSQFMSATFILGTPDAGVIKCVGYYDDQDGIFLQLDENGPVFIRRSSVSGSVVDVEVRQDEWNIDRLDGTGGTNNRSGITLDLEKSQLLTIDLQWLSAGRVRIGFDIGGSIIYCHQFLAANVLDLPYMRTAVLPMRYEIHRQTAGAVSSSMKQICSAVMSEGGQTRSRGLHFSADNGTAVLAVLEDTPRPILSIRPALLLDSIVNRVPVFPLAVELFCATSPVHWEVIADAVLTGADFDPVDPASAVEFDVAATSFADGTKILGGYCTPGGPGASGSGTGGENLLGDLELALRIAGTEQDNILTLTASAIGGAATVAAEWTWRELQ